MPRVQIFEWEAKGKTRKFSVDAALELIRQRGPRRTVPITLECAKEGISRNYRIHELKKPHIAKADFNQPLIFISVWDPEQGIYTNVLIDGWHRAMKMVLMGRTEPL